MVQQRKLTKAEFLAQLPAARERGRQVRAAGLCATAVWYDPTRKCIMMTLTNGRLFGVARKDISYLKGASSQQLATVTLLPGGNGSSWPALDIDLSVEGLLYQAFPIGVTATLEAIEVAVAKKTRSAVKKHVTKKQLRKRPALRYSYLLSPSSILTTSFGRPSSNPPKPVILGGLLVDIEVALEVFRC